MFVTEEESLQEVKILHTPHHLQGDNRTQPLRTLPVTTRGQKQGGHVRVLIAVTGGETIELCEYT